MITKAEAEAELNTAENMNPGLWINHSKNVAKAAEIIISNIGGFDTDLAYCYGLLHDIGRRNGFSYIKHIVDGYKYLLCRDTKAAVICLSHSFPNKLVAEYQGQIDIDEKDYRLIEKALDEYEYDIYDYIIQLADSYASADGFVRMECRWIDVTIRSGFNEYTIAKWETLLGLKKRIENEYSIDIEEILGI
jgi:putative nucleotidyltransferase with HDIG domain